MEKLQTVQEVFGFLHTRKKYWLLPIMIMLILIGLLIVLGESSALGPFIYPFF